MQLLRLCMFVCVCAFVVVLIPLNNKLLVGLVTAS